MTKKSFLRLLSSAILASCINWVQAQTATIYIDDTDQSISGFGGMNFPRWIADLSSEQTDKAFGNGQGQLGLSILRISVPPNQNQWSAELATAQRAASHGAKVFATPWSPPAAMKDNNSTTRGSLKTDFYDDYAYWLRDFTNYFSANGVNLYAIAIQNEPDYLPDYESCGWTTSQMLSFLNNNASVIPTRIIAPETVHYKSGWMDSLKSSSQVDILANHAYGGSPSRASNRGSKEHWMTEHAFNSSVDGNDMVDALEFGKEIYDFMVNGYNAYVFWYIRRYYGLITEDGNISKRGFTLGHYSKFIRPGFVRVQATGEPSAGVNVTAYKEGNTLVFVAINRNASSRSINFNFSGYDVSNITKWETTQTEGNNIAEKGMFSGGSSLSNTLAAHSITTFRGTIGDNSSPYPVGTELPLRLRARSTDGQGQVRFIVGGNEVANWTLSETMSDYNISLWSSRGEMVVEFHNDAANRDVQIDYLSVGGTLRQAEDQSSNTGVWQNGSCGSGSFSEMLHCNGAISFGNTP